MEGSVLLHSIPLNGSESSDEYQSDSDASDSSGELLALEAKSTNSEWLSTGSGRSFAEERLSMANAHAKHIIGS